MNPFHPRPAIVGHRGAPRTAPENSPVSFMAAAAAGATWVELDVRRSADDVLVVHHDPTTGDGRALAEQTADELSTLGVWSFPAVCEALPPGLGVDVEVKNLPGEPDFDEDERTAALVVEGLRGRVGERPWMTSSFNPMTVSVLSGGLPEIPAGLLHLAGIAMRDAIPIAEECGARVLCPQVRTVDLDAEGVAAAHAAGYAVLVWTVDDTEEAARLAGAGVDAICTNDPAVVVARLATA
jgi:glycerophosphoryl diester phosphodiesterase